MGCGNGKVTNIGETIDVSKDPNGQDQQPIPGSKESKIEAIKEIEPITGRCLTLKDPNHENFQNRLERASKESFKILLPSIKPIEKLSSSRSRLSNSRADDGNRHKFSSKNQPTRKLQNNTENRSPSMANKSISEEARSVGKPEFEQAVPKFIHNRNQSNNIIENRIKVSKRPLNLSPIDQDAASVQRQGGVLHSKSARVIDLSIFKEKEDSVKVSKPSKQVLKSPEVRPKLKSSNRNILDMISHKSELHSIKGTNIEELESAYLDSGRIIENLHSNAKDENKLRFKDRLSPTRRKTMMESSLKIRAGALSDKNTLKKFETFKLMESKENPISHKQEDLQMREYISNKSQKNLFPRSIPANNSVLEVKTKEKLQHLKSQMSISRGSGTNLLARFSVERDCSINLKGEGKDKSKEEGDTPISRAIQKDIQRSTIYNNSASINKPSEFTSMNFNSTNYGRGSSVSHLKQPKAKLYDIIIHENYLKSNSRNSMRDDDNDSEFSKRLSGVPIEEFHNHKQRNNSNKISHEVISQENNQEEEQRVNNNMSKKPRVIQSDDNSSSEMTLHMENRDNIVLTPKVPSISKIERMSD